MTPKGTRQDVRPDVRVRLLALYRFMKNYQRENQRPASQQELVASGLAGSRTTLRYYLAQMERYNMIERKGGQRGIYMLPPSRHNPYMKTAVE